jgi:hypothetical protein
LALGTLLLLAARPVQAVTYLEQIERLRLINAFLLDYRPGQDPMVPQRKVLDLSLDIIPNPSIDNRVGLKNEPVHPPPVIPRFRLRSISPAGWMLGATASPPVVVQGYAATWLGVEGGLRGALGFLHAELRVFAIAGRVKGPITERDSEDSFAFFNRGGDLRLGVPLGAWRVYGGAGRGKTDTALDIAADGVHIESSNDYDYLLAGAGWASGNWRLTFEQHRTEDFLSHVILAASYRWQ